MKPWTALIVLLILAFSAAAKPLAAGPIASEPETTKGRQLELTRIFYLQDIAAADAMRLLRTEAEVHAVAAIAPLGLLIASDAEGVLDDCENLLVAAGALARTAEPHGARPAGSSSSDTDEETRVFRIETLEFGDVSVVLRSIYRVRELSVEAEKRSVSVTATGELLDMIEATLRELDVLSDVEVQP